MNAIALIARGSKILSATALVLGMSVTSFAAEIPQYIKDTIKTRVDNGLTKGIVVGYFDPDGVTYFGYGSTGLAGDWVPNEYTLFEIGSITKSFTGILLAVIILAGCRALGSLPRPPANPLLPAGVIYQDDFEQENVNWDASDDGIVAYGIDGGRLVVTVNDFNATTLEIIQAIGYKGYLLCAGTGFAHSVTSENCNQDTNLPVELLRFMPKNEPW